MVQKVVEDSSCLRGFGTISFDQERLVIVQQKMRADTSGNKITIQLDPILVSQCYQHALPMHFIPLQLFGQSFIQ